VQPLHAVAGQGVVLLGLQEALGVQQQDVAGREQTGTQPEQLPALLLAVPAHTHTPQNGSLCCYRKWLLLLKGKEI